MQSNTKPARFIPAGQIVRHLLSWFARSLLVLVLLAIGASLVLLLLALTPGARVRLAVTGVTATSVTTVAVFALALTAVFNIAQAFRARALDGRSRATRARSAVAKAIVARRFGLTVTALHVGVIAGEGISHLWRSGRTTDAYRWADRNQDELLILFAGTLAGSTDQRRDQIADRARKLASRVALNDALQDTIKFRTVEEITARTIQLTRDMLASVPDGVRESIEDELMRTGHMRGERFEYLLDAAAPTEH